MNHLLLLQLSGLLLLRSNHFKRQLRIMCPTHFVTKTVNSFNKRMLVTEVML